MEKIWGNWWGKTVCLAIAASATGFASYLLWGQTFSLYQEGRHDFLLPVAGFFSLVFSLWTLLLLVWICTRIMYKNAQCRTLTPPDHHRRNRLVLADPVVLTYIGVDESGFGSATHPVTGDLYLLNQATTGHHWQELDTGTRFLAQVTRAQYVTHVFKVRWW